MKEIAVGLCLFAVALVVIYIAPKYAPITLIGGSGAAVSCYLYIDRQSKKRKNLEDPKDD